MPSLQRRRERDLRADRLESEIRSPEQHRAVDLVNTRKGLLHCTHCKGTFEERSTVCPRCDRKDGIGYIRPIPEEYREKLKEKEIKKARARLGL